MTKNLAFVHYILLRTIKNENTTKAIEFFFYFVRQVVIAAQDFNLKQPFSFDLLLAFNFLHSTFNFFSVKVRFFFIKMVQKPK
jgi:hypothetical protein